MQAIILASGMGRRLDDADRRQPKALPDVVGRSLVSCQLDALEALGVSPVIVTTGYLGDQVEAAVPTSADLSCTRDEIWPRIEAAGSPA